MPLPAPWLSTASLRMKIDCEAASLSPLLRMLPRITTSVEGMSVPFVKNWIMSR